LLIASWEKERQEYPESLLAFAIYIRDEVRKNRHLRAIEGLAPTITNDEELFCNYLNFINQSAQEAIREQLVLEERLRIPSELKAVARNPEAHLDVKFVYDRYLNIQTLQQIAEYKKQKEAEAIAARNSIVPVDRNSQEYQDAFLAYKKAVSNEERVIQTAQRNDPTWARARELLKIKNLGGLPVLTPEEREFTKGFDNAKRDRFNQWKSGFAILTANDTTEKEWKEEPKSRPAILFIVNVALARMKSEEEGKVFDQSSVDLQAMLKGDKTMVEKYFSLMKEQAESLDQMESLEKELRISSELKDAMKASISDSTLFYFMTPISEHLPPTPCCRRIGI